MLSVSHVQCDEYAGGGNNYLFVQGQGKEEVGPLDGPALPARIGHNVRVGIVADIGSPLPRGTNDESLLVEGEVVSTLTLLHSYDSIQRSWLGECLTVNLMDLYISF